MSQQLYKLPSAERTRSGEVLIMHSDITSTRDENLLERPAGKASKLNSPGNNAPQVSSYLTTSWSIIY